MHPLYLLDAGRQALTLLPIMSLVRTRFAPSPTGYLHIGGARTALFNWLFARKMGGTFILRIEDTDNARNTEEATRAIFTGMEWLGLDWDEGPMKGGDCGPYFQSQRNDIYDAYFKKLQDAGRVYEDDGAWRFRFDRSKPVTFHDLICGDITIDYRDASNTPDMAIRRADGSYIFHFVNVVDDIEMGISHVIRGDDHDNNTPKQILIYQALGAALPVFGHVPMILGPDKQKLSKRHGAKAVIEYDKDGLLPEALVNYLARLGWSHGDQEIFSMDELIQFFDGAGLSASPACFDPEKLLWVNAQHLRAKSPEELLPLLPSFLEAEGLPTADTALILRLIPLLQPRAQTLVDMAAGMRPLLTPAADLAYDPVAVAKALTPEVRAHIAAIAVAFAALPAFDRDAVHDAVQGYVESNGLKFKAVAPGLRVALLGSTGGPDLMDAMAALGKAETLARLERAQGV